jgi:hypothetical protein
MCPFQGVVDSAAVPGLTDLSGRRVRLIGGLE